MSQKFIKPKTSIWAIGKKSVLSTKNNPTSFIDISLCGNDKSFLYRNAKQFHDDIIQIESGEHSMIAVTRQGNVYGRGKNKYGELAFGDNHPRHSWTPIPFPCKVKQIACKFAHSLFLTQNGQVYSCGNNEYGQLGTGDTTDQTIAKQILINEKSIKVISSIGIFSFVLCESSKNGSCESSKNETKKEYDEWNPNLTTMVQNKNYPFENTPSKTTLYGFGCNDHGQLVQICIFLIQKGVNSKQEIISVPTKVDFFDDKPSIQDVKAGWHYAVVLLENGSLYAMGSKDGCGQGVSKDHFYSPVLVSIGNANKIASISCTSFITAVQTFNSEYYAFGHHRSDAPEVYFKPHSISFTFPKGIRVKKLVSTDNAVFLLNHENEIYVCGHGRYGEMGIKNNLPNHWTLCKENTIDIQTGSFNSFFFTLTSFLIYEPQMKFTDIIIYLE